jgi:hypothetical protein
MKREELDELHYITPIANIASILSHGILSHRLANRVRHESVAMQEVQDIRKNVVVPNGRRLHEYVNLYICARNPMLYKRKDAHASLSVLRVSTEVLDINGVIVTDMNAARSIVRFSPVATGLAYVDHKLVFADDWRHPGDPLAYDRHRAIKCAEVLVPDRVPPKYITGVYVSCVPSKETLLISIPYLGVVVNPHLFFL